MHNGSCLPAEQSAKSPTQSIRCFAAALRYRLKHSAAAEGRQAQRCFFSPMTASTAKEIIFGLIRSRSEVIHAKRILATKNRFEPRTSLRRTPVLLEKCVLFISSHPFHGHINGNIGKLTGKQFVIIPFFLHQFPVCTLLYDLSVPD